MADLIDRQAAMDAIVNTVSRIGLHDNSEVARYGATFRQHEIIDIIESLPSAQPEIVRCKDCKYYNPIGVCIEMNCAVCEDSFCCWAERKENGKV